MSQEPENEITVTEVTEETGLALYEKKALAKVDPLRQRFNELKEKHKEFPDLSTAAGIKKAKEQIKDFRDLKGDTEDERKSVVKLVNSLLKDLNGRYDSVWDDAETEQKDRDAKLKAHLDEQDRLKKEKEAEEAKRLEVRKSEIYAIGATFNNATDSYTLGEVSISRTNIQTSPDEIYQSDILRLFKDAAATIEAERQEQVRLQQEAEEKQRQEAEQLRQEQEKLQQEQAQLKLERLQVRLDKLAAIGYTGDNTLMDMTNDEFTIFFDVAAKRVEAAKKEESDRKERERIAAERKATIDKRLKVLDDVMEDKSVVVFKHNNEAILSFAGLVAMSDEEFDVFSYLHNKKNTERKEKAEQERLAEVERQRIESEKKALLNTRITLLLSIGYTDNFPPNLDTMGADEWDELYASQKAIYDNKQHEEWLAEQEKQRELDELVEKERTANMEDGEKWREWKETKLKGVIATVPPFKGNRYQKVSALALEKLSEILAINPQKYKGNKI